MSKSFTPIVNTNSFNQWVLLTNQVANAFAQTVTTAANSTGDVTTGNAFVVGIFGSTTLTANTLRGGNVTSSGLLTISSNVAFSGDVINYTANVAVVAANVSLSTNSTVEAVGIRGNSTVTTVTVRGTSLNLSSNVTITANSLVLPSGNTSTRPGGATAGTFRYNTQLNALEVYTSEWEIVSAAANSTVLASEVFFANNANVSASDVQSAILETWNEKASKTGDTFTGDVVVNQSGASVPTQITDTAVHVVQADGQAAVVSLDATAAQTTVAGRRSNGTNGSRTTLANNDVVVSVSAFGYDGNSYQSTARATVELRTAQAWTNTAHGTAVVMRVTPIGSNAPVETLRLISTGLTVNTDITTASNTTSNNISVTSQLTVTGNTSLANVAATNIAATANISANVVLANSVNVRRAANTSVDGVARFANSVEFQVGTNTDAALQVKQVWDAANVVALTDDATIAANLSSGFKFSVTLGGNRTLGEPTSLKIGQSGYIVVKQDATGSRTLAYHADWEFAGGTAPTLSTAANAKDILFYEVLAANSVFASLIKNVS